MILRPYQLEANNAIHKALNEKGKALAVMATGTGKTAVFSHVAEEFAQFEPVLALVHREEILYQMQGAFESRGLSTSIEKGSESGSLTSQVVCASVASIKSQKRLDRYTRKHFGLVIVDECHHAAATSYTKVLDHFEGAYQLGVTATPYRLDRKAVQGVFGNPCFIYPLAQAIEEGYLCPVVAKTVVLDDVELSKLNVTKGKEGKDFVESEMAALVKTGSTSERMVLATVHYAKDRKTVIFAADREHGKMVCDYLQSLDKTSVYVDGESINRKALLREFETDKAQFLVNVGIATEGYDHPPIACVSLMFFSKSLAKVSQCVGRGTRLHPTKKDLLVLDFSGVDETVQTVKVFDVMDSIELSDEVRNQLARDMQEWGDDDEEMPDVLREMTDRQTAWERVISRQQGMRHYRMTKALDLIRLFGFGHVRGSRGSRTPSERQMEVLRKNGISDPETLDFAEASRIIDLIIQRGQAGLCSIRQQQRLLEMGYDPQVVDAMTYQQASIIIGVKPPSDAQKYYLNKCGYSREEIAMMNLQQASKVIGELKQNNGVRLYQAHEIPHFA